MKDNFDLRKFLSENKLTANSRQLNEDIYGGYFDDDYDSNDGSSIYGDQFNEEEEEDQEGDDYNYDVTEEVEVGMRVVDAENDLFEVTEVTPTRITLEPVGYEGENVYFPEDFGKDVNIEDFWFHLEEQEEERTGMFGEPSDSDEWGSSPF